MTTVQGESPGKRKSRILEISLLDDGQVSLWIYNPPRDESDKGWEIIVSPEDLLNGLEQAQIFKR